MMVQTIQGLDITRASVHLKGRSYRVTWQGNHCVMVQVYMTSPRASGYWKPIQPDGKIGRTARKYAWDKRAPGKWPV